MNADQKIHVSVADVIGTDSRLMDATVGVLQDQLLAAREAAADAAEKKFLAALGTASVVAALAVAARPRRKEKVKPEAASASENNASFNPPPLPQ